jgi:serralysin
MADSSPKACFDRILSPDAMERARQTAAQRNLAVPLSPLEGAVLNANLWRPGATLRVRFLDGQPEVQQKVAQYAQEWTRSINLGLQFCNDADAEIRISFQQPGSWSYIGTDALGISAGEPTMNYGWLTPETPDDEYSRVVLHEFGHALGMIHEHQNPAAGIRWNKEAVYRALGGPPNNWDRATVDHNMFETYSRNITQFTTFDPDSIMLYFFPKEWTTDGMEFGQNSVLSSTDREFMQTRYPGQ